MPVNLTRNTHLDALTKDAEEAIKAGARGPDDTIEYEQILETLREAQTHFPPTYRDALTTPLIETFERIKEHGWTAIRARDPQFQSTALLGVDLVQAAAQRIEVPSKSETKQTHETEPNSALKALQEVVSDLYDGFLSAADRGDVKPPDHGAVPPLVKWGRPGFGPYAWTTPATASYGCDCGLVNMPPAFRMQGLAAWAALGHETSGHQVLHADDGLRGALARAVYDRIMQSDAVTLSDPDNREALALYWSDRIDESASDVMGVVNMGPAAALGLIAYFRALSEVYANDERLDSRGGAETVHPAPLARAYLMAEALGHCSFPGALDWRRALLDEVAGDAEDDFSLARRRFSVEMVQASAAHTASAILTTKVAPIEGRALIDIQDWRPHDEEIVQALVVAAILGDKPLAPPLFNGIYAAHAVAASIIGALITGRPGVAQGKMIALINQMHRHNPAWTTLQVAALPGDAGAVRLSAASPAAAASRKERGDDGVPIPFALGGRPDGDDTGDTLTPALLERQGDDGVCIPFALVGNPRWPLAGADVITQAIWQGMPEDDDLAALGLRRPRRGTGYRREPGSQVIDGRITDAMLRILLGTCR